MVQYEAAGGAPIGGLVDGLTYKVVTVPGQPNKIKLTTLLGDPVALTPAIGSSLQTLHLATPKSGQDIVVKALTEGTLVHVAGNYSLGNPTGAGVGTSFLYVDLVNNVQAEVQSGAHVHGNTVLVQAQNNLLDFNFSVSGGRAGSFGFNGTGSVVDVTNVTRADIGVGAEVTTGSAGLSLDRQTHIVLGNLGFITEEAVPGALDSNNDGEIDDKDADITGNVDGQPYTTDLSLLVMASDDSSAFNIAGALTLSTNTAIGVTVGVNVVNRNTQAYVGSLRPIGWNDEDDDRFGGKGPRHGEERRGLSQPFPDRVRDSGRECRPRLPRTPWAMFPREIRVRVPVQNPVRHLGPMLRRDKPAWAWPAMRR